MKTSSKYFDSIRIAPGGKKRKQAEEEANRCQWEGCNLPGQHKCPAGRNREGQYLWFCTKHAREYNKNYNYFSGLNDDEIAKFQKESQQTGERPTWKMGTAKGAASADSMQAAPVFSRMRSGSAKSMKMRDPSLRISPAKPIRRLKPLESKAMRALELDDQASAEEVRKKYKELVKRHHPDSNGGDRTSEERFRDVVQAYKLLKTAGLG
ncbi:MAG: J domain-containing protein [Pseudomonadota bacterium]